MSRPVVARKYGKKSTRTKADRLFAELPQSPVRDSHARDKDDIEEVTKKISNIKIDEGKPLRRSPRKSTKLAEVEHAHEVNKDEPKEGAGSFHIAKPLKSTSIPTAQDEYFELEEVEPTDAEASAPGDDCKSRPLLESLQHEEDEPSLLDDGALHHMTWDELCPVGDQIVKIAEASYAEVYRITNEQGTSIIKVIRLESPIRPKTKTQIKAGLIDEEPRSEADVQGELQISELLAGVPGFVIYKERYVVQGKTTKHLLETHQTFHRRMKRQDPGRAQFYPSPSRYLDETKFLVVELGDAGKALEDWRVQTESQLWDIFFLEAVALARAEEVAMFEHRDLHEGNLCLRQTSTPRDRPSDADTYLGWSGLDITILDYGLSRAEDMSAESPKAIACDLEKDLSLFTSTHAPQCTVYRQMRSRLLGHTRRCLPVEEHNTAYPIALGQPLSWNEYEPYTNVLWLAYLYQFLVRHFAGDKKEVRSFRTTTVELWAHLNPSAKDDVDCFNCAQDIVDFALLAGWIRPDQVMDGESVLREESIIMPREQAEEDGDESLLRRSPRRRTTRGS